MPGSRWVLLWATAPTPFDDGVLFTAFLLPRSDGVGDGSGQELAAHDIHQCSRRAAGSFVAVDCDAIAPASAATSRTPRVSWVFRA